MTVGSILEGILKEAFSAAGYEIEAVRVVCSNRPDLCDWQCDDCFKLAKTYRMRPFDIGNKVVSALTEREDFSDYFAKAELCMPGFINLTLSDRFISAKLVQMNDREKFDFTLPKPERYIVDYGGPNVAKPLHVGHLRSAIVGESIKRIIGYSGHETIGDVHLGDYGLQIGQVIYGFIREGLIAPPRSDGKMCEFDSSVFTLDTLERIYPLISGECKESEDVKNVCAELTRKLQDGDEYLNAVQRVILKVSGDDILRLYKFLDVHFELWEGESDAYPYIPTVTKWFADKNLLRESDGALVVDVAREDDTKEIPPLLFRKANGAYLYGTTDLATVYKRMISYKPDHMVYITDMRQSLHFEQVFRACRLAGLNGECTFEHDGFGTVNGLDGKPFKTRSGDAPKLDSLFKQVEEGYLAQKGGAANTTQDDIDKIVGSILKFADLSNNRERDYIFDISKFSSVVGKTGPYLLYTYLRINKVIVNALGEDYADKFTEKSGYALGGCYGGEDRSLRLKLLLLENAYRDALNARLPSVLCDYLYETAVLANAFYENNRINTLCDSDKKRDWLYVLALTNKIQKSMLTLLGISVPSVM